MGSRIAALALLALVSAAAFGQSSNNGTSAWKPDGDAMNAVRASVKVGKIAGSMSRSEVRDLGSQGIDLVAQFATPDGAIHGTIFLYRPSLPDSGLAFLATDAIIRQRLGDQAKIISDSTVAAGRVEGAARRVIYAAPDTGIRSALAIVQAGGWMATFRVSGPGNRANEIAGNLDALLASVTYAKSSSPIRAHIIKVEQCLGQAAPKAAKLLKPSGQTAMAMTLLAIPVYVDESGSSVADPTGRVPDRLCLMDSRTDGQNMILTYRAVATSDGMFSPRLFQLVGDAGTVIEVTRPANESKQLFALRHGLGRVALFGAFASEPSFDQLEAIRKRSDELPIVAIASDKPEGGTDIELDCETFAEGCSEN